MAYANGAGIGTWPPRSPHEALLSTPGGRQRLRDLQNGTSPSPSPIRRSRTMPSFTTTQSSPTDNVIADDEDEETLELRLQEIRARLKLKRLQKQKGQQEVHAATSGDSNRLESTSLARTTSSAAAKSRLAAMRDNQAHASRNLTEELNIPVSPVRKTVTAAAISPCSPQRVLLGIDKGLKAKDVSLRRVPVQKTDEDTRTASTRLHGLLGRSRSQDKHGCSTSTSRAPGDAIPAPKTFSERMKEARESEVERRETNARVQQVRSTTFDLSQKDIETYKELAVAIPRQPEQVPTYTRDQILRVAQKTDPRLSGSPGVLRRAAQNSMSAEKDILRLGNAGEQGHIAKKLCKNAFDHSQRKFSDDMGVEFELFSSMHLSKRILPHTVVTRTLAGKKTYSIPQLLQDVKGPDWNLPEIEEDIVLMAVVASKSAPKTRQANTKSTGSEASKYMVFTLTDLKWELELFLFNTGFEKYWKLEPGSIIAILNPTTMPPLRHNTGKFSLVINSNTDTILEIGVARDLGHCKSVKKDGKVCNEWIDNRRTEFCEFHTNAAIEKTLKGRMEVNSMSGFGARSFGNTGLKQTAGQERQDRRQRFTHSFTATKQKQKEEAARAQATGKQYVRADGIGHIQIFAAPNSGLGRTTASLLDDDDIDADAFHHGSKSERLRQRLAEAEKERILAQKLAATGAGAGAAYMKRLRRPGAAHGDGQGNSSSVKADDVAETAASSYIALAPLEPGYQAPSGPPPPPDAAALGLLSGQADDVRLSPIKRKRGLDMGVSGVSAAAETRGMSRSHSDSTSQSTSGQQSTNAAAARGWGGALTKELGRMKEGGRLCPLPQVKKQTRILTAQGIKTPGRESFGGEAGIGPVAVVEDDSDDLEIV